VDPNFRISDDQFPLTPLTRLVMGLNAGMVPISSLTAEGYANAAAMEAGTTWDFRGLTGTVRVLQEGPVTDQFSCYIPENGDIPDRPCGFDLPGNDILLLQDDLETGARDVLAIDYDDAGTYFLRAWAIDEGWSTAGPDPDPDDELRLCFSPDGDRKAVPFVRFANDDGMGGHYITGTDPPWASETFECSLSGSPFGVAQEQPCGAGGGVFAVLTDGDGTNGRVSGRIANPGTVTLPSGHVLDALMVEILASFRAVINPLCIPTGNRNRQYLLIWFVPEYGPIIQIRSDSDQDPDLSGWTIASSTVVGYGLLPPLTIVADSVGPSTATVTWEPGLVPDAAEAYEVHWGTVSGHVAAPANSSGPLPAALGNTYTVTGLLPETDYWISVSSRRTYTDPYMGVVTDYQSIVLPTSIGADVDGDGEQDVSYPPEVMVTTLEAAAEELAINRQVGLDTGAPVPPLADVFDPACTAGVFTICADEFVPGPLDGMRLSGELVLSGSDGLRFYEHSDGSRTMKLAKRGNDLLLTAN
jgi:hypothetical protein